MGLTPSPVSSPVPTQNWISRNWKWFVPTGCLTLIVLFFAFLGGMLFLVFSSFKASDAYQQAITKANTNTEVVEQLGNPLKPGWYFLGNIQLAGSSGHADVEIPISGPKNSGKLFIVADKKAGEWQFEILKIEVKGQNKRIDLLLPDQKKLDVQ